MVNNSNNMNQKSNHLSPQLIEYKKDHHKLLGNKYHGLDQAYKFDGVQLLMILVLKSMSGLVDTLHRCSSLKRHLTFDKLTLISSTN